VMLFRFVAIALATVLIGCGGDDGLVCVDVDLTCAPLYAPTWANVSTTTLMPKCGVAGCHSTASHRAGLVLDDSATARDNLVGGGLVVPGEVSCSVMIERIFSTSPSLRMPRGGKLSAAESCAVAQWVAAGAPGPVTVTAPP
jgi:Planctomycete cytochrome C